MAAASYPLRLEASLDPPLSRWLWLVKWLLAIPHYIVLFFLWVAFAVLSIVAFFAILFTGRYPRSFFEFNVGVLRWTWRVSYYTYGALGTDRYPPFTLEEVPDYPTHLDVTYPEHLSRGLVLVKWWLLAIPHYIVVGLFVGGGAWAAGRSNDFHWSWGGGGLIGILVLVAAVVLLFTGRYPLPIFDFVLGMNRWALRVAAYAGLMTDRYPPFRLDLGGHDPGGTLTVPPATSPAPQGGPGTPPPGTEPAWYAQPTPPPSRWTAGRVIALVAGSLLTLISIGLLAGGGVTLWADRTQRDAAGFLTTGSHPFETTGYALATRGVELNAEGPDWVYADSVLGTVRVRAAAVDPEQSVFIGVARKADVTRYLAGVEYATVTDFGDGSTRYETHNGAAPATPPTRTDIWAAQASGKGTQSMLWKPKNGNWQLVVMNTDNRPGVAVLASIGAKVPALPWVATGLLIAGFLFLVGGVVLLVVAVRRRPQPAPATTGPTTPGPPEPPAAAGP